jgi:hypothetical protein
VATTGVNTGGEAPSDSAGWAVCMLGVIVVIES